MERHIAACTNATLPGGRRRLLLGDAPVGWLDGAGPDPEVATGQDGLQALADRLERAGRFASRGEMFDVRDDRTGRVVATLDRGALPAMGVAARGVHLNGLVRRPDGVHLWIARRAADKKLDPGKLDNMVGGGVPAGMGWDDTLLKEAEEEAALTAADMAGAAHVATIGYDMVRPEGLRRDRLRCYDLWLPDGFAPRPVDGEVAGFELWPLADVADAVRRTDDFKFNVNLVLIDLFLRLDILPAREAAGLRSAMAAVRG